MARHCGEGDSSVRLALRLRAIARLTAVGAALIVLFGCGGAEEGGGTTSSAPPPGKEQRLSWIEPPVYNDNVTPLDLRTDVPLYEIHASETGFFDNDTVVAYVNGVDGEGVPVQSFDMNQLAAFGVKPNQYVSVRTLSKDNVWSEFGDPCWWDNEII